MSQAKSSTAKTGRSPAPSRAPQDDGSFTVGHWWRRGISALLILHLVLVVAVPLAIMGPSSRLATAVTTWTRPWIDMTQLSHGYGFFATEPGPSHLIEYDLRFADGTEQHGQFPNLKNEKPRLRYHRHFMLSEKANTIFGDPYPPRRPDEPTLDELASNWVAENWRTDLSGWELANGQWQRSKDLYKVLATSFGQHLLAHTGAQSVRLQLVRHLLSSPDAVGAGADINDLKSYIYVPNSEVIVTVDTPPAASETAPEEIAPPGQRDQRISIPRDPQ